MEIKEREMLRAWKKLPNEEKIKFNGYEGFKKAYKLKMGVKNYEESRDRNERKTKKSTKRMATTKSKNTATN